MAHSQNDTALFLPH